MAFITPPIYKCVHKQNMGYFLFIVVLLNQRKKPLFIKYQSYLFFFFKKLTDIIELSTMHLYELQSIMLFYKKDDAWREAYSNKLHVSI